MCLFPVAAAAFDDPEDSPLYASSMNRVFGEMANRDRAQSFAVSLTGKEQIIALEGKEWSYASQAEQKNLGPTAPAGASSRSGAGRPGPLDVTTDLSCGVTCAASCMATTCGASCDGSPTCRPAYSCHWPPATCSGFTCTDPTCQGPSCSSPDTCSWPGTCTGFTCGTATCQNTATCLGTCIPANCPTTLSGVSVPQAGQIQLSFSTSAQLRYTLQSCTNLSAAQWTDVTTVTGNGQAMTLSDTNAAGRVFYRVWVQSL